jgi:hypothetical protein
MSAKCNVMFCVAGRHADDRHVDVTGYTWTEATPEREVIAHIYEVTAR